MCDKPHASFPFRPVVSRDQWLAARTALLNKEKEFTRLRDELSRQRREMPWVRVDKDYFFVGEHGRQSLAQLFGSSHQLIVYHFMFAPGWSAGCPICSFWADNFNGLAVHLRHRDTNLVAISRAPYESLRAYRDRMGWTFTWLSSHQSDFNFDFGVSFTPEQIASTAVYNYETVKPMGPEMPGISVFIKNADAVYHTYSCFSRGLDMLNAAYHYLDLSPLGRNEADQYPHPMAWVRRHDEYLV